MGAVRTNAAAAMLGISPNTLRGWERRFGYPSPSRTAGGHRQYELTDIEALRQAFSETHNVSSAISIARERGTGPASPSRLAEALRRFDEAGADRVMEESLAVRSVERSVAEVLLEALDALDTAPGAAPAAPRSFAARWAMAWLAAARRVAPPVSRAQSVLVFDGTRPQDADALHVQALDLYLRRSGLRTVVLAALLERAGMGQALRAAAPQAVVFAGRHTDLDAVGRLVYAVRQDTVAPRFHAYRSALPAGVPALPSGALAARDELLGRPPLVEAG